MAQLKNLLAVSLVPVAMGTLPGKMKFEKLEVGGLSGLVWTEEKTLLLSDDRGKNGDSRFYEAGLKINGSKVEIELRKIRKISRVPGLKDLTTILDPEGLARLPDGSILVSSEADTNRKPREPNRILHLTAEGEFLGELKMPDEVQAEPLGQQKKGTVNNAGPEGLSLTLDSKYLWVGYERALYQETEEKVVRLDRHRLEGGTYKFEATHRYKLSPAVEGLREIIRGVSEVLAIDENRLLVLERSAHLVGLKIGTSGEIYVADCSKPVCSKKMVVNFEGDLKKFRKEVPTANFEGLSWGPVLPDGRKTVLMMNDNNFTKDETEIIAFAFKDEP